jgi:hypothetical protein
LLCHSRRLCLQNSKVIRMLRPTVSRQVCYVFRHPSGTHD